MIFFSNKPIIIIFNFKLFFIQKSYLHILTQLTLQYIYMYLHNLEYNTTTLHYLQYLKSYFTLFTILIRLAETKQCVWNSIYFWSKQAAVNVRGNWQLCHWMSTNWNKQLLNSGIRQTITINNLDLFFADLKLGIIDMYLRRLKERQHRKKYVFHQIVQRFLLMINVLKSLDTGLLWS